MSWGRLPFGAQRVVELSSRFQALPALDSMLPYGNGRSYGDVCLNDSGSLLAARRLDRFIAFDPASGVIDCEAGVLFSEIIDLVLPSGWFLPVTPGTCLVTVGGAIANDVHGKNHHRLGSMGHHVSELELLRSDGQVLLCGPQLNREWFAATVGGMGLTGLIRRAKIQLRRVPGPWVRGDNLRFSSLDEFFALSRESDRDYEYTVAWIDCAAAAARRGRGILTRGNHAPANIRPPRPSALCMPFIPPVSLVNSLSVRAFNQLYFHRPASQTPDALWHYRPFFYPLDGIGDWNRMYGPRGFFQYQCVVPPGDAGPALNEMLARIGRSGMGSFLAVLKTFGDRPSPGMMSFPRPGATLALDFPNRGAPTLSLLESLDQITRSAGGAVYPAKDARMSAASFQQYFPEWRRFGEFVDPRFSSSFWRRVTKDTT